MKMKIVEFLQPGRPGGGYFDGRPGAFTTVVCEDIEFTPCGIYLKNIRETAGRPEPGPQWVSRLVPLPPNGGHVAVIEVEWKDDRR